MKTVLCIPTFNAAETAHGFVAALRSQTCQPEEFLVIDSESDDNTAAIFRDAGAVVQIISHESFNHGRTRQLAIEQVVGADIVMFMTQDALLARPDSIENLLGCFADKNVGIAFGRQLPSPKASHIAAHARLFNYPEASIVKTKADIQRLGIKACFCSNSFAAYRLNALGAVGGFPTDVILNEDTYVASRMLLDGWKIAYCAESTVYHSHNISYLEEFRRYFDIGVFHSREAWILDSLGKAEGEGKRFVISEIKYLKSNAPGMIPFAFLRTVYKYLGFKLGSLERRIPIFLKKKMSMNRGYWD